MTRRKRGSFYRPEGDVLVGRFKDGKGKAIIVQYNLTFSELPS